MEQELPTPKQEIQDLTNESTNALKDGNIDETEKVKLDRLSQKIRDFVAQKKMTNQLNYKGGRMHLSVQLKRFLQKKESLL